ncbi:DUF1049 domain-containing protein [Chromatiaceae bacterium AAb-1]|nr:DUF1049 domain-containing protein [Chromatiaceae bacterium AAb-1]
MSRLLYIILVAALILTGFLFGSVNQQITELNLLVVQAELRVVDIALIFLLTGLAIGIAICLLYSVQRKTQSWLKKSSDKT